MQINKAKKLLAKAVLASTAVLGVSMAADKEHLLRTGGQTVAMNNKPISKVDPAHSQPSFNHTMQVTVAPPAHLMGQALIGTPKPAAAPPSPMG